jgi:hypothetical protein
MMKLLPLLFLGTSFLWPSFVAQAEVIVSDTDLVSCSGPDCNWCSLIQLFDNVIDFLFTIFTLAAVAMVMYVGFKMVTSQGSSEAWEEGKKMFSNLVIGFVIFLSAWLIVDTILKGLIDTESGFGVWNELGDCDDAAEGRR